LETRQGRFVDYNLRPIIGKGRGSALTFFSIEAIKVFYEETELDLGWWKARVRVRRGERLL